MEGVLEKKIKVGISECCFGAKVRYNARGFDYAGNFGRENSQFVFYPACPECMAGLGVPRSPISIKGGNGYDVLEGNAKVKNRFGHEVTRELVEASKFAMEMLLRQGVYIFIYKEGSPSCGVYRTTLKNKRLGHPPGVFGAMLLDHGFFLASGEDLESPVKRWDIRRRMNAFVWVKELSIQSKKDLYDMWHQVKFLCQELDQKTARELGVRISALEQIQEADLEDIRTQVLNIIRTPSNPVRIKTWLWKNYTFYQKTKGIQIEEIEKPTDTIGSTRLAEELIKIENRLYKEGWYFGSSPVMNRSR